MTASPTLDELHERRAFDCRLTPDRALGSLDEAEAFLLDRGLLTRTADSALPSLFAVPPDRERWQTLDPAAALPAAPESAPVRSRG